ncbi:hypothetical protein Sps_03005 [Shewanella psychrophila]|uniref:Uncharacterized protein n=1 Tax=Shewanella psychrophila TaxID=225848 RepID=A0A1S6HRM1_9GAMM|nr:hypothetical protein [Shewanella psychrophila]AQS38152.1 hypothetical protein Sps_03005 [Shewanella psychrophila]
MDSFILGLVLYLSVGIFFYLRGLVVLVSEFFQADSQFSHLQTVGMMLLLNFASMVLLITWPKAAVDMVWKTAKPSEIQAVKGWDKNEGRSFSSEYYPLLRSVFSVKKTSGLALLSSGALLMTMVLD